MKSILRYLGKKSIELNEYNIKQYKTYCEPFSGSFNTGIELAEKGYTGKIIYNDLDKEVCNFFERIADDSDKVYKNFTELNNILKNESDNNKRTNILKEWQQSDDVFKIASAEYIYRKCLTTNGLRFTKGLKESTELIDMSLLQNLFNRHKIEINNLDYKEMISRINTPDTFIMVDPPYINCESVKNYRCESKNFNHKELCNVLKHFKGKWLLIYNKNSLIEDLYKDYNIKETHRNLYGKDYIELYITNKKEK